MTPEKTEYKRAMNRYRILSALPSTAMEMANTLRLGRDTVLQVLRAAVGAGIVVRVQVAKNKGAYFYRYELAAGAVIPAAPEPLPKRSRTSWWAQQKKPARPRTDSGSGVIAGRVYATGYRYGAGWR